MVHINSVTPEVNSAEFWGPATVLEVNLYDDQRCSSFYMCVRSCVLVLDPYGVSILYYVVSLLFPHIAFHFQFLTSSFLIWAVFILGQGRGQC
jgi:hypothetical protein